MTALPASHREPLADGLRGAALLGILLVNVQSFDWGPGNPLGYFEQPPGALEQALFFMLAALVAGKFYTVFALLFGFGFTLQTRRMLLLVHGRRAAATALYLRRLGFLLAAGVLHAALLYFGDILVSYALCALFLVPLAWARTRTLLRATRAAWCVAAAALLFWSGVDHFLAEPVTGAIPAELSSARAIYLDAGYAGQLAQRWHDGLGLELDGAWLAWPQIVALMLLGALAGRLGWLRRPHQYPRVWRGAARIGIGIGLPCALLGGWLHLETIRNQPDRAFGADALLLGFSGLLTFAYIAAAVRWRNSAAVNWALRWLAPAGRMPLTNYIVQSVAMGALLSGWGLRLGATASRVDLTLGAIAFYVLQVLASRALLARTGQGPLEALWRRFTYRGLDRRGSTAYRPAAP